MDYSTNHHPQQKQFSLQKIHLFHPNISDNFDDFTFQKYISSSDFCGSDFLRKEKRNLLKFSIENILQPDFGILNNVS